MEESVLKEIIGKTDLLTAEEQLRLIVVLAEKVRIAGGLEAKPRRKWLELSGILPYPACGEDAQTHISRARRESDEHRIETPHPVRSND
ncbi:MAG: hypothetical protein AB1646_18710 [Thermodesulfobacteriota bacterium]